MKDTQWSPQEIRALRERLGMTQQQLADAIGLGRLQRVSDMETGRRKPSGPVAKWLDQLNEKSK